MSKSNIEQLIADKLQSLSFDFKPEYWDKMNEKLDADCAKTNTCNAASMGGFFSASLLVVFFAIISFIAFSPWGINKSIDTKSVSTVEIQTSINKTPVQHSPETNSQPIAKQENNSIKTTPPTIKKSIRNNKSQKVSKTRKHYKKAASSKHRKTSKNISNQSISKGEDSSLDTNITLSDNKNTSSINTVEKEDLQDKSEFDKAEIEQSISSDTLTTDTDYFYESELGNKPDENEKKEVKVKVQKKPVPVKHVKTRSKPIKRVFKRKRGILYRLGIRK